MGRRVLIVDDSYGDRMILKDLLISFGYHVVGEAKSGKELIEMYDEVKPDLVILDAAMKEMDGPSTVRTLMWDHPEAVVLVAAGHGQRSLAIESLHAGAKDFVTKPFKPRQLMRAINLLIRQSFPTESG